MTSECYACTTGRDPAIPPREAVLVEEGWRVAHAFNSSLPGWLVVLPARHLTSMGELTLEESAALGPLLQRLSRALESVVGCSKTYLMLFAEAEGFSHLHIHLVPRMDWFTDELLGPRVFTFLSRPESEWLSESDRDALAVRLRAELVA